ncbi:MAG: hypothetical protein COB65_11090 [Thalassobium sp.]|uniref:DUF5337 domain-containing protein n=1 Tax=Octadecabacter sp. SW4 TaxID=2602067 RepID=UPI000C0EAC55|nr:DUF5337 domain-containing protein [Octadecabacter sp. SW4]PHQ80572.1 MAG: hypothetical protein COB65_11090 [Thalassobium sp.]QEE36000.1 hypothetical protein FTO60_09920 [Octadecabacter sp. SW4]
MTSPRDPAIAKQARVAAIVIACSGILAIIAPVLVAGLGLAPRFEFLFYLLSLAGFIWSLVVTYKIWQKTRK